MWLVYLATGKRICDYKGTKFISFMQFFFAKNLQMCIFFRTFALAFGKASHRSPLGGLKAQPASALPTANSLRLGLHRGPQYSEIHSANKFTTTNG